MNFILIICYILYISSLLIGFFIEKKRKDELNTTYHKFKPYLTGLITINFIFVNIILIISLLKSIYLLFIAGFIMNILFNLYFYLKLTKSTRCDKQHTMIFYNFFTILIIYICSLHLFNPYLNLYILLIVVYNILEFQFAKFGANRMLIWD